MKTYLVGGAVRNELLGLPVTEKDWVVVGSTEAEMLNAGFTRVGRDFPVFLHPDTKEEHALARTERKVGPGYQGFECNADPSVTLEEDLLRRDLTINAIARSEDGELFDPYHGQQDIKNCLLRHVSEAFREDPLRVLRVARFKATLHKHNFEVAAETDTLLRNMVQENMLVELTPERVFAETLKAFKTDSPAVFMDYLLEIGAHDTLWPEISSAGIERLRNLPETDNESRFIALIATGDQQKSQAICDRLKCSKHISDMTRLLNQHLDSWQRWEELDATGQLAMLEALDAFRREERFAAFNKLAELISGRPLGKHWQQVCELASKISIKDIDRDIKGPAISDAIRQARVQAIARISAS